MTVVCHKGYRIAVEHPAVWVDRGERIVRDLIEVVTNHQITDECLEHLIASHDRLIAGHFELAASNVTATATLGFLGITATGQGSLGNNKFVDVDVDLSLKNPTLIGDANRVTVSEITGALKNGNFFFDSAARGGSEQYGAHPDQRQPR